MAHSFLDKDNIFQIYRDSKRYTELLTKPFPEFERIARNRPSDKIQKGNPTVTDGTTASIISKTPRRVVQQIPTGVIECDDDNAWLPVVAQFIYTNKILPYATEDYDIIQKSWLSIEHALTFGSTATYTPFLSHDGNFSPDMTFPYWGDLFIQRGKKSGYSHSYLFMRSWWQKADLEALIDSEQELIKNAKKRGEKYEATWITESLKKVLDNTTEKDNMAITPSEKERGVETSAIELVTGFQKGVGADFITFNPATSEIVRVKKNKDPRGKMPIDWMYGDIDGTNPLGRGIVELIGGLQNLIDSDMQMYQLNRALALNPPVITYGNIRNFKYAPNVVVKGTNPTTDQIKPLVIDTTAIANYPQLYQLQQSQLFNLVTSPQSNISGTDSALGQGKTPTAIKDRTATISVDDNFIRKMFESFFGNWSETAINIHFAERSGVEELQLDEETAKKLRKLANEGKFDISQLSDDNKIVIDYDTATPALHFRVDASTSKMKNDADQLQALQGILETLNTSPMLQGIIPQEKILGLYNSLVANSGVEDPEDLSVDIEQFKQEQLQAQQAQMDQQAQMQTPQMQGQDPEDAQVVAQLKQLGFSDQLIQEAMDLLAQGRSPEEVMQALSSAQKDGYGK